LTPTTEYSENIISAVYIAVQRIVIILPEAHERIRFTAQQNHLELTDYVPGE